MPAVPVQPTILVVDDDAGIRETLTEILGDAGYQVATAGDGIDALAYLRHHSPPALILLDWMMPRCDGPRFRAAQRSNSELARVPVVLMTAHGHVEEKCKVLAVDDALAKPIALERLLAVLARYCPQP